MNLFVEYLENLNQLNLILTVENKLIKDYTLNKKELLIEFESTSLNINLDNFDYEPENLTLEPSSRDSLFRLRDTRIKQKEQIKTITCKTYDHVSSLKCLKCSNELLKLVDKPYNFLKLPENDLDELADNFFCHLHDHNHNETECHGEDLTNTLNPLRDTNKLRKSILGNLIVMILNSNHLNPDAFVDDLKCSKCNFNIGYKNKRTGEFHLWKSNIVVNGDTESMDLGPLLTQGKYLIESETTSETLYLWIMNDKALFKHYKFDTIADFKIDFNYNIKKSVYKTNLNGDELKRLKNDCIVTCLNVSVEQFEFFKNILKNSTNELPESLKGSNGLFFAVF